MQHYLGSFKEWAIISIAVLVIYGLAALGNRELNEQLRDGLKAQALRVVYEKSRVGAEPDQQRSSPSESDQRPAEAQTGCAAPSEIKDRFQDKDGNAPTDCTVVPMIVNGADEFEGYFPVRACTVLRYDFTGVSARTWSKDDKYTGEIRVFYLPKDHCEALSTILPEFVAFDDQYLEIPKNLASRGIEDTAGAVCPTSGDPANPAALKPVWPAHVCMNVDLLRIELERATRQLYSYDLVDMPYSPGQLENHDKNTSRLEQMKQIPKVATLAIKELHILVTYVEWIAPFVLLIAQLEIFSIARGLNHHLSTNPKLLDEHVPWFPVDIIAPRPTRPARISAPGRMHRFMRLLSMTMARNSFGIYNFWVPRIVSLSNSLRSAWYKLLDWIYSLLAVLYTFHQFLVCFGFLVVSHVMFMQNFEQDQLRERGIYDPIGWLQFDWRFILESHTPHLLTDFDRWLIHANGYHWLQLTLYEISVILAILVSLAAAIHICHVRRRFRRHVRHGLRRLAR